MFRAISQNIWQHSLECLVTFPVMFEDITPNVWRYSPRMFREIPRKVLCYSPEYNFRPAFPAFPSFPAFRYPFLYFWFYK